MSLQQLALTPGVFFPPLIAPVIVHLRYASALLRVAFAGAAKISRQRMILSEFFSQVVVIDVFLMTKFVEHYAHRM